MCGALAKEPPAGGVHDDVVKFLEPERVIVADANNREAKEGGILQRNCFAHLGPHPLVCCGEWILLFAEIKQHQVKGYRAGPRCQPQARAFRNRLAQRRLE